MPETIQAGGAPNSPRAGGLGQGLDDHDGRPRTLACSNSDGDDGDAGRDGHGPAAQGGSHDGSPPPHSPGGAGNAGTCVRAGGGGSGSGGAGGVVDAVVGSPLSLSPGPHGPHDQLIPVCAGPDRHIGAGLAGAAVADDEAAEGGRAAGGAARTGTRRDALLLNAIETALGDGIYDAFPLYLRAIGVTVVMGRSVEETRRLMARHLRDHGVEPPAGGHPWEIVLSPLGGRGVVATRDLQPGDLVLVDPFLALGPRAGSDPSTPLVCAGCLHPRDPDRLRACKRGCRLPVCADSGPGSRRPACEDAVCHAGECALLRRWGVKGDANEWSATLLRTSAAVRCLALPPDQREILASMQSHYGRHHAFEVNQLLECLESSPKPEEERFMRLACCVMDANAFRMTLPQEAVEAAAPTEASTSASAAHTTWSPVVGALRGLYPLGALLNHECTPNTRHSYDALGRMVIRAARPVACGQELTVTYSALLWGSPARRQHLLRTKHFLCACDRCKDPTEGGTCLAALPCPSRCCAGPVLPVSSLSLTGPWRCRGCALDVPPQRASLLQSVLGGLLQTLYLEPALPPGAPPPPDAILRFLEDNSHLLPASNHITVELKADVVWTLGHRPGLALGELSAELLQLKESLVRELLATLQALRAGRCSLSGMLMYELHCTLMERGRRDLGLWSAVAAEALDAIEVANEILAEDNAAPTDLAELRQRARLLLGNAASAPPRPAPTPTTPVTAAVVQTVQTVDDPTPTPSPRGDSAEPIPCT